MKENGSDNQSAANDDDKLRSIIAELDNCVPVEGAWVRLTQYGGGPDEGQMIGNRNGYRRLGIEFLKATLNNEVEQDFDVNLEYLISSDSTIGFDWFELSDNPLQTNATHGNYSRLMMLGDVCRGGNHLCGWHSHYCSVDCVILESTPAHYTGLVFQSHACPARLTTRDAQHGTRQTYEQSNRVPRLCEPCVANTESGTPKACLPCLPASRDANMARTCSVW